MARAPLVITSLQNPRVKDAAKLREGRARARQGRIVIDGMREIERALDAGVEPSEAFVCPALCEAPERRRVAKRLAELTSPLYHVSEEVFSKLAFGERAEGAVLVAQRPRLTPDQVRLDEPGSHRPPLIAVLERLEKPGNVGAVARSADGAGVSLLIVIDGDPYAPQAIRASLGTIFSLKVAEAESEPTRRWLAEQQIKMFAALVEGSVDYAEADYRGPTALILGSEAHGLSSDWRTAAVQPIRIPMLGAADSLNVSAAAAVLFYEAYRQRAKAILK